MSVTPAKIDKLIKDLYVDTNELRDTGYTQQQLEAYCLEEGIPYKSLINRLYWHETQFKKWIKRGNITNPSILNTEYQADCVYWREIAIPFLISQEVYFIRYDKKDKLHKSMCTLECLQKVGKQKIKTHLNIAADEAQIQAQVGGKLIDDTQAKYLMKDIKNIRKLALNIKDEENDESEVIK